MTKILSLALVVIYVLIAWARGVQENDWVYAQFGLSTEGIISGKLWQFLSYGALHGNFYHLSVNVILLWLLGKRLECTVSSLKLLVVVVSGIVLGGCFHLAVNLAANEESSSLLVGFSGGLMALLLCLTTLDPYRVVRPLRVRAKHLGLGFLYAEAILTLITPSLNIPLLATVGQAVESVMGESIFLVAHACHLGGGIGGMVVSRLLLRSVRNI